MEGEHSLECDKIRISTRKGVIVLQCQVNTLKNDREEKEKDMERLKKSYAKELDYGRLM